MKDIIEVVEGYGIDLRNKGSILLGFCPFHDDTKKPNLTIYRETNSWFCFACNEGGDEIQFVSKIGKISRAEAKIKLGGDKVELQELQEKIDGIEYGEENITLNNEVNLSVSKKIKKYLQDHPDKHDKIFEYLKSFDNALLKPVFESDMKEILNNFAKTSKNFV